MNNGLSEAHTKLIVLGLSAALASSFAIYRLRSRSNTPFRDSSNPIPSCIIKFGGSACTKKDSFETINQDAVNLFGEQLSEISELDAAFKPLVIHGAGSFGHFQAKQYSVSSGAISETGKPENSKECISPFLSKGFAITRLSVSYLNFTIVQTLIEKGLPAVSVHPFPFIPIQERRMSSRSWPWESALRDSLAATIRMGLIPVLHGDACIDTTDRRTGILSGDTLLVYLCKVFRPEYAVFLADVDGILTAPPGSNPPPELIHEILVDESGNWSARGYETLQTSVSNHDVTGGILTKIEAAVSVVRDSRIPLYIVKAGTEDAKRAMRGMLPFTGTIIRFENSNS